MNHFMNLYQIALQRHKNDLREAAQDRLRRITQAGHNSDQAAKQAPVAKESLTYTALYKTTAILKGLAAGLLIWGLAGWGFVTTTHAQTPQVLEVGCTNGVGDVNELILAINFANIKPQDHIIELAENCVYTLTQRHLSSANGLPAISDDLVIEGNGATIQRSSQISASFRLLAVENGVRLTLRNLTLQGGLLSTGDGGAVRAGAGTVLTLVNVKFVNNRGRKGGAVYTDGGVTIRDGEFSDNLASLGGGGLFAAGPVVITNTTFLRNEARQGGGLYSEAEVSLSSSRFEQNLATNGGADSKGGGLFAKRNITLDETEIISNTAVSDGGGLYIENGTATITGGRLASNQSDHVGGGVYIDQGALTLTGTTLISNTARRAGGGETNTADVTMIGSQLIGNSEESNNGNSAGLEIGGDGVIRDSAFIGNTGLALRVNGLLTLDNSQFIGNRGSGAIGIEGSITNSYFADNRSPGGCGGANMRAAFISGNTFVRNRATILGGALCVLGFIEEKPGTSSLVINNLFIENESSRGAAIYALLDPDVIGTFPVSGEDEVTLLHNTIVHQFSDSSAISLGFGRSFVFNNIISQHRFGIQGYPDSIVEADHNLFFGNIFNYLATVGGPEDRTADPRFVAPANDDFHLRPGSPAIDTALDKGVAVDLEGVLRPQGNGFDRGAFELKDTTPNPNPDGNFTLYLPLVVK